MKITRWGGICRLSSRTLVSWAAQHWPATAEMSKMKLRAKVRVRQAWHGTQSPDRWLLFLFCFVFMVRSRSSLMKGLPHSKTLSKRWKFQKNFELAGKLRQSSARSFGTCFAGVRVRLRCLRIVTNNLWETWGLKIAADVVGLWTLGLGVQIWPWL